MKYIDADRLKAEIERRKQSLRVGICSDDAFTKEQKKEMLVASEEIDRFNRIIDSLQQEQPETFDTAAFQKGVAEGRRLEREDVKSTIQSRIDEILGDAQPNPVLRMELQELIKKIEL